MFSTFKPAVLAALISAAAATVAPAQAHDFHVRHPHARFSIYLGDYPSYDYFRVRQHCTPERALYKAGRIGVHAARIDYVSERRIGVIGRSHGERVYLTFGRAPGCPRFE